MLKTLCFQTSNYNNLFDSVIWFTKFQSRGHVTCTLYYPMCRAYEGTLKSTGEAHTYEFEA